MGAREVHELDQWDGLENYQEEFATCYCTHRENRQKLARAVRTDTTAKTFPTKVPPATAVTAAESKQVNERGFRLGSCPSEPLTSRPSKERDSLLRRLGGRHAGPSAEDP